MWEPTESAKRWYLRMAAQDIHEQFDCPPCKASETPACAEGRRLQAEAMAAMSKTMQSMMSVIMPLVAANNPALLPLLTSLRTELPGRRVGLDAATRRNLELTRSVHTGGSRGSLLGVLMSQRPIVHAVHERNSPSG